MAKVETNQKNPRTPLEQPLTENSKIHSNNYSIIPKIT
jgi:hypothetical protein